MVSDTAPRLLEWTIAREERRVASSLDYLRTLAGASGRAFVRLGCLRPLAWYRRAATAEAYAVARISADDFEGCEPCRGIAVHLALEEGADPAVVRAVLTRDVDALPPALGVVRGWTRAVMAGDPMAVGLGEEVEAALGSAAARAELAIGMSVGRVFPMLRRAMGHGAGCALPAAAGMEP